MLAQQTATSISTRHFLVKMWRVSDVSVCPLSCGVVEKSGGRSDVAGGGGMTW